MHVVTLNGIKRTLRAVRIFRQSGAVVSTGLIAGFPGGASQRLPTN